MTTDHTTQVLPLTQRQQQPPPGPSVTVAPGWVLPLVVALFLAFLLALWAWLQGPPPGRGEDPTPTAPRAKITSVSPAE